MSNATHTPGPWNHEKYEDEPGYVISDEHDNFIAEVETEDHAKLIAAAPDLLKALKLAANFIENVTDDDPQRQDKFFEAREAWNAAIAKATK